MSYSSSGGSNPPWQRNLLGNAGNQSITNIQGQIPIGGNTNIFAYQSAQYPQSMTMNHQQQQQQHQQLQQQHPQNLLLSMPTGPGVVTTNINQMYDSQQMQYESAILRGGNIVGGGGGGAAAFGHLSTSGNHNVQFNQLNTYAQNQQHPSLLSSNNDDECKKIGIVTKLMGDYGIVDDEVLFYKNVCIGPLPKCGDHVLLDAVPSTQPNYKWMATRVRLFGNKLIAAIDGKAPRDTEFKMLPNLNEHKSSERYSSSRHRNTSPVVATSAIAAVPSIGGRSPHDRHRHRDVSGDDDRHRSRRGGGGDDRNEKDRYRSNDKRNDRSSVERRRKERSPARSTATSPIRRRDRFVPRYKVHVPKIPLNITECDRLELRRRYPNLIIPNHLFFTKIRWTESFPLNAPFSLHQPCSFHLMHNSVEPLEPNDAVLKPSDADNSFNVQVMLMGIPSMNEVYRKCFLLAELDKTRDDGREDDREYVHPTRLINFLVGIHSKTGSSAIGGPWSPSLDGPNPESDPSVLIRTAIRTFKAVTGIDLSPCTQWYRFVEIYYNRSEATLKGHIVPEQPKVLVVYLPDIRSCLPTRIEWEALQIRYKSKMEQVINALQSESDVVSTAEPKRLTTLQNNDKTNGGDDDGGSGNNNNTTSVCKNNVQISGDHSSLATAAAAAASVVNGKQVDGEKIPRRGDTINSNIDESENPNNSNEDEADADADADDDGDVDGAGDSNTIGDDDDDDDDLRTSTNKEENRKLEPSHYSELCPKMMKVSDLRDELDARNLSSKGLKSLLVARLAKAIKIEETSSGITNRNASKKSTANNIEQTKNDIIGEGMDVSDIVEYVSTKPIKQLNEKPIKTTIKKPLDERERQLIESRYTLPENPQIIVHTSNVPYSSKYTFNVISLSLLLDYGPNDLKHDVVVPLFAELFNDMLMRDFGYTIYKTLYSMPDSGKDAKEKKKERERPKDKEKDKEKEKEKEKEKAEEKIKHRDTNKSRFSKKDDEDQPKEKKIKTEDNRREMINRETTTTMTTTTIKDNVKMEIDNSYSSNNGKDNFNNKSSNNQQEKSTSAKDKDKNKDKKRTNHHRTIEKNKMDTENHLKYYTANPDLLLSFVYFDQTQCGYIYVNDLENIFLTLGLALSKGQISRLIYNTVSGDSLYYRKLTDKPKEIRVKLENTPIEIDSAVESYEQQRYISIGNNALLPIFKFDKEKNGTMRSMSTSMETCGENNNNKEAMGSSSSITESDSDCGMILYNGGLINVEKLLEQMRRSEKAREQTEQILMDSRKINAELTSNSQRSKDKIKELQTDIKSLHRKLSDTEQSLSNYTKKFTDHQSILSHIYDKLCPVFNKSDKSSSKSGGGGSDLVRDKDKKEKCGLVLGNECISGTSGGGGGGGGTEKDQRDRDKNKEKSTQKDCTIKETTKDCGNDGCVGATTTIEEKN